MIEIDVMYTLYQQLEEENKKLKVMTHELKSRIDELKNQHAQYSKAESCLLFKIQKVKQKLNDQNIRKSGHNKFKNYEYYELEDINKPITDALLEEGLASKFYFTRDMGYLRIIDSETGAWTEWETRTQKSERYMKQFSVSDKKGDVGDLMKDEQALQTYSRRALYLQALEITEPNTIEQGNTNSNKGSSRKDETIKLPDNDVFKQIQNDFKKGAVPLNKETLKNKLGSMKQSGKINDDEYKESIDWINTI